MKKLLEQVLGQITPTYGELVAQKKVINELLPRIRKIEGKHVRVAVYGSVGRQTQLANDNDIDIFVLFPHHLTREEFEKEGLRIAKTALTGHPCREAHSEHPYIQCEYNGFDIEIIPAYHIKDTSQKQSAVDRTPFHHAYLEKKLKPKQKQDVRLLKQFLKGINCYGADLEHEAFSGYATELLIVHYGNFPKTVSNIARWKTPIVIDLSKKWKKEQLLQMFPTDPLILIDPTDKNRNVAAAVSVQTIETLLHASKAFLKKPRMEFFFPKPVQPFSLSALRQILKKKTTIGLKFGYPTGQHPDTYWGQLKRLETKLKKQLEQYEFKVISSKAWTNEQETAILFELESGLLPSTMQRIGPPKEDEHHVKRFLEAHRGHIRKKTIQKNRIVLTVPRKYRKPGQLLENSLKELQQSEKAPLQTALTKKSLVMDTKRIQAEYAKDKDFRDFATKFLRKQDPWKN